MLHFGGDGEIRTLARCLGAYRISSVVAIVVTLRISWNLRKSDVTGKYLYWRDFHNNIPKKSGIFEPNEVWLTFGVFPHKMPIGKKKERKFY